MTRLLKFTKGTRVYSLLLSLAGAHSRIGMTRVCNFGLKIFFSWSVKYAKILGGLPK